LVSQSGAVTAWQLQAEVTELHSMQMVAAPAAAAASKGSTDL